MRITREPAVLALSIWLILTGLISLLGIDIPGVVMAIVAVVAGGLLLLGGVRLGNRSLAVVLLAAYLLLLGLAGLISLGFAGLDTLLAVLALAAGVLLLLRR
jgi:hypothetical protein